MPMPKRDIERLHITLPTELKAQLDLYLHDPVTGRPRYRGVSRIVEELLRRLLAELQKPGVDPKKVFAALNIDLGKE